jgi:ferredoxin
MILCFSGTGNSLLAAKKLAILMKEKIHILEEGELPALKEQERLVLTAPLYFWTLPCIVLDYLARLRQQKHHELHVVMTCGGALGAGASLITRQLQRLGFQEVYVYSLIMTTNYIPLYQVLSPEKAALAIRTALEKLPEIAEKIRLKSGSPTSFLLKYGLPVAVAMYNRARRTRHFYVTSRCISCGLCERNCPDLAIRLHDGSPEWIKPGCTLCLRCLHHCPAAAIEYGKGTVGKKRYRPEEIILE